ncbi:hypothetical protein BS47DRAFT_1371979 [Hydnum rufescens UP504]|uniref:SMP-LTD domain-containing protein n=1 Tax=Hydnum rufescens UP504 TaxID=1448309 RepID=A0A9P6B1E1_9AGAM|nr:hypothetical protein BS47DRAFT_1371979 [Hydnum rufescens UP504]
MSILSLTPTFTQGFILGQLSIFCCSLSPRTSEAESAKEDSAPLGHPQGPNGLRVHIPDIPAIYTPDSTDFTKHPQESLDWCNFLLANIVQAYRADLRGNLSGLPADETARRRVEKWTQQTLNSSFMAPVKIHSVTLGTSAPRLSNARVVKSGTSTTSCIEFDLTYTDTLSMTLSTSFLFNHPTPSFARLPISLSLSLSLFSAVVTPQAPSLTLSLRSDFTLSLTQSSLMGSRAKLSDVPKVHQMIEQRLRNALASKTGLYRILLPGIGVHGEAPGMKRREVDIFIES